VRVPRRVQNLGIKLSGQEPRSPLHTHAPADSVLTSHKGASISFSFTRSGACTREGDFGGGGVWLKAVTRVPRR